MKKQIRENLDVNWTEALEGMGKHAAIEWLQNNIPENAVLDLEYDYDTSWGCAFIIRDETDEEENTRAAKEVAFNLETLRRKAIAAESQAARVERIRTEDADLYAYLSKHKGNPAIGDLENLFRVATSLEREGKSGTTLEDVRACARRLEACKCLPL